MTDLDLQPTHNPYAPPQTDSRRQQPPFHTPHLPNGSYPRPRAFVPGGTLGRVTQGVHGAFLGIGLVGLVVGLCGLAGVGGLTIVREWLAALAVLGTLVLAPLFCVWLHRAYTNLLALGREKNQLAAWWASASFFIPIVNVIVPWQVAWETWVHSQPLSPGSQSSATDTPPKKNMSAKLVGLWWLACVCWFVAGFIYSGVEENLRSHSQAFYLYNMVLDCLTMIAAVSGALLVRGVDRRQLALYRAQASAAHTRPATDPSGLESHAPDQ